MGARETQLGKDAEHPWGAVWALPPGYLTLPERRSSEGPKARGGESWCGERQWPPRVRRPPCGVEGRCPAVWARSHAPHLRSCPAVSGHSGPPLLTWSQPPCLLNRGWGHSLRCCRGPASSPEGLDRPWSYTRVGPSTAHHGSACQLPLLTVPSASPST